MVSRTLSSRNKVEEADKEEGGDWLNLSVADVIGDRKKSVNLSTLADMQNVRPEQRCFGPRRRR